MRALFLGFLFLLFTFPVAAQDLEPDPVKLPTAPKAVDSETSGSVVIVNYKGAKREIPGVTRSKEEARTRAEEAFKKARAKGVSFFDVVKEYSDDGRGRGSVGVLTVGNCLIPQLEKALFGMEYGQVSEILDTDLGYLIAMRLRSRTASSHILFMYKGSMSAPNSVTRTKEEAKKLAEEALERVTKGAEDFAKVAAECSDCPSKTKGGFLGMYTRGIMASAFEDAAFPLAPGEISGVVETEFGFHVIKGMEIPKPMSWGARHILLMYKGSMRAPGSVTRTKDEAKAEIEKILKRLQDGEDFAKVAGECSDCPSKSKGGDLGTFGPGQMVKEFEEAVKACEPEGITGIVETPFGFHIIKRTQ